VLFLGSKERTALMVTLRVVSGLCVSLLVLCFAAHGGLAAGREEFALPAPALSGAVSLEETLVKRRSKRSFRQRELTQEEIGQLLWAGQGVTGKPWGQNLRTAPSAGALYPLELYAVTKDGVFHYLPDRHALKTLGQNDQRARLAQAVNDQSWVGEAPLCIVLCAVYSRVTARYRADGMKYTDMEAGHAAQNILLQAVALGLGAVPVGAFRERDVQDVLGVPAEHLPLYVIPIGKTE
jgi:SagB-type dehydrogenase family enzyme